MSDMSTTEGREALARVIWMAEAEYENVVSEQAAADVWEHLTDHERGPWTVIADRALAWFAARPSTVDVDAVAAEAARRCAPDHGPGGFDRHGMTESGWLTSMCVCHEYAWPCPVVIRCERDLLREAIAALSTPEPVTVSAEQVEAAMQAHWYARHGHEECVLSGEIPAFLAALGIEVRPDGSDDAA